jgi:hypothetical protein
VGTQRSSSGPGPGVPFIPPWVEPVPQAPDQLPPNSDQSPPSEEVTLPLPPVDRAPAARFKGARLNLGGFAKSGSSDKLKAGLAHYVRTGLGGAARGESRMAGTATAVGRIYGGLSGFRAGEARPLEFAIDRESLAGRPAREVGDRIIDAVCPVDGSLDTEARRDSLSRAISELTEQFPDADLTALTAEQVDLLLQGFLANDLCHRIEFDVGKAIFEKAPDLATAVSRMEELRQYVREKVDASFRTNVAQGVSMTRSTAASLASKIIRDTLTVFEEYL